MTKYLDDQGLNTLIGLIKPEVESAKSTATAASSKADSADTKADLAQTAVSETQKQVNSLQETVNGINPDNFVKKSGDTMTGPLLLTGEPTADNQAVTKAYVDKLAPITPETPSVSEGVFAELADGGFMYRPASSEKTSLVAIKLPAENLFGLFISLHEQGSYWFGVSGAVMLDSSQTFFNCYIGGNGAYSWTPHNQEPTGIANNYCYGCYITATVDGYRTLYLGNYAARLNNMTAQIYVRPLYKKS